jgi:hypothetical protein
MTEREIIEMAESVGLPEFENNESQAANLVAFVKLIEERVKQTLKEETV